MPDPASEPLGPEFRLGLIAATILLGRKLHELKATHNVDQMAWAHRLVKPILADLIEPPVEDWEDMEDELVAKGLIPEFVDPFVGHVDERGRISITHNPAGRDDDDAAAEEARRIDDAYERGQGR